MTYSTLMVVLELGSTNKNALQITSDLAALCRSKVIGIAARQPIPMVYGVGYVDAAFLAQDRDETDRQLSVAEQEFRASLPHIETLEWRSSADLTFQIDYFAREARHADLLVKAMANPELASGGMLADNSDLIMRAGRPVIVLPRNATPLALSSVVIGWKDTRETRRAIADALPLLQLAAKITVITISPDQGEADSGKGLADVVSWLSRHGVTATPVNAIDEGDDHA